MKTRKRRRSAHRDAARSSVRAVDILTIALTIGMAAAFLVEGITGSRAAMVGGNVAAVALGTLLLLRRR